MRKSCCLAKEHFTPTLVSTYSHVQITKGYMLVSWKHGNSFASHSVNQRPDGSRNQHFHHYQVYWWRPNRLVAIEDKCTHSALETTIATSNIHSRRLYYGYCGDWWMLANDTQVQIHKPSWMNVAILKRASTYLKSIDTSLQWKSFGDKKQVLHFWENLQKEKDYSDH